MNKRNSSPIRGKIKLLILLAALLLPALVYAQDDFPGGGFPTYPPGTGTNFPVNGGQWQWGGVKWGPVQIPAPKGATIVFDVVGNCGGCYWRFAIEYASPMISAGKNMRLTGDYNRWHHWLNNGQDVTFCQGRCEFQVEAGEDYPWLWLAFDGNSDWYNQIEIKAIIPPPSFKVLSDSTKEKIQRAKSRIEALTALASATAFYCLQNTGPSPICSLLGGTAVVGTLTSAGMGLIDPWDDAYGYPYEPSWRSEEELGLTYLDGGYGDPFWDTWAADNNLIVDQMRGMATWLDGATVSINRANSCAQIGAGCEGWQAERALTYLEYSKENSYWIAAGMWEASWQLQQQIGGNDYSNLLDQMAWEYYQYYEIDMRG